MKLHRRHLVQSAASAAGLSLLPRPARAAQTGEPHFFLQVFLHGGLDPTYFFDARPLEFTTQGAQQNYLTSHPAFQGQDVSPLVWADALDPNVKTLVSPLVKPLEAHRKDFSILNGIHMDPALIGHPQNAQYLLTGSGLGGDAFFPLIGAEGGYPLSYVYVGDDLEGRFSLSNMAGGVRMPFPRAMPTRRVATATTPSTTSS